MTQALRVLRLLRDLPRTRGTPQSTATALAEAYSTSERTVYRVGPEAFADTMKRLRDGGVWGVGGCCGTTPEHIRALAAAVSSR